MARPVGRSAPAGGVRPRNSGRDRGFLERPDPLVGGAWWQGVNGPLLSHEPEGVRVSPPAAPPFHDVPVFGDHDPRLGWRDRPVVYGLGFDEAGRLLVVDHEGYRLLPGGGIDPGEDARAALVREALEETGHAILVGAFLGHARHYYDPKDGAPPRHKLCRYHAITIEAALGPPTEPGHVVHWLPLETALASLSHAVDRWAVLRHRDAVAR
ncbi:MAG: NUDIX domain-containing protein [Geminicoccaceae bacterium]|nr:MAG: NUDIX domain-containing protein [Geminicoccaceae bacterium]